MVGVIKSGLLWGGLSRPHLQDDAKHLCTGPMELNDKQCNINGANDCNLPIPLSNSHPEL